MSGTTQEPIEIKLEVASAAQLPALQQRPIRQAIDRPTSALENPQPLGNKAFFRHYGLFFALVVLPCLMATIYLFGIASDRYVSEIKFIVRTAGTDSIGSQSSGLSVGMHGLSRAHDDAYVVNEFIVSRDALHWLIEHENLRDVFSVGSADFLNRYPNFYTAETSESFYRYFTRMVQSELDDATGISTVSVQAFSPNDAQRVARGLIHASEAFVNRVNARSYADAVAGADEDIARAKSRVSGLEERLQQYRSQAGFVDVQAENLSALKTITALSTSLARLEATLNQSRISTPAGPATRSLEAQVASMKDEIARQKKAIAGSDNLIASKAGEYSQLIAELGIAQRAWANAETYKETARRNAERQHLYLQTVVDANAPDQYSLPRRKLYLLLTFIVTEMIFIVVRYIRQYAFEHTQ